MKHLILSSFLLAYGFIATSQNGDRLNDIKGYRLKPGQITFIYQTANDGSVDVAHYRTLNNSVFFSFFTPNVEKAQGGRNYTLIFIPGNQVQAAVARPNGAPVSSFDFNQSFWIETPALDGKVAEYIKYRNDFVLGALTVPFKFRPALGKDASSGVDGSFNLGPYVGYKVRLSAGRPFFLIGVLSGGPTSITYNSSNNSNITDKNASQTGFGFQGGGGLIFDLYKIQLGIIFACDHGTGDLSKTFKYQNNLWMAFSLSFNFLGNNATSEDNQNKPTK